MLIRAVYMVLRSVARCFLGVRAAQTSGRRQYVITLVGALEIGLGDGYVHRFGPGEGILAEDLTGQGHTTRAIGDEPLLSIAIPLTE